MLAGGAGVSVCQLEWESSATVLALTDPDGWWNLHRITPPPLDRHRKTWTEYCTEIGRSPEWTDDDHLGLHNPLDT